MNGDKGINSLVEFSLIYADEYDVPKYIAKDICKNVFALLAREITDKSRVYIPGLGTFKKKMVAAHRIGDVNNGGVIEIPAREKIVFDPSPGVGVVRDEYYEDAMCVDENQ